MSRGGLLLVLVAIAAGTAIGYVVGTGRVPVEDRRTSSEAPVRDPEPAPPRTSPPEDLPAADPDLARALAGVPVPEAAWGSGRVPVLVRTEEGEPLPGVLVRAVPVRERFEDPDRSGRLPEDPPLEELVLDLVGRTLRGRAERVEAVTGEDGTCELVGLADLPYRVGAFLEGWSFRGETDTSKVRSGSEVRFRAADRARLELTVLLPDGTEPEVAQLEISGRLGTGQRRWTPNRRDAWLPPDHWTITATAGEIGEFRSSPVDVLVPPEGLSAPLMVRLDPRTGIRGHVVLPEGDLGAAGKLRACRLLEGEDADTPRLLDAAHGRDVKVGQDGRFVLLDLAPGTWVLGMVSNGESSGRTPVLVSSGLTDCEVVLPAPDLGNSVHVDVLGPDEKREERVSVVSELRAGERRWSGPPGIPLRSGGFRVVHAKPGPDHEGGEAVFSLIVRSRLYGDVRVPYDGPGTSRVEVKLEEPATLTVQLTGYVGSGHVGNVKLILVPPAGRGGGPFWPTDRPPDDQGRYQAGRLVPGEYRIVVQAMLDKNTRVPASVTEVWVEQGENRVEVPMPPLYSLTILSDAPSAKFALHPSQESGQRWRCPPRTPNGGRVVWEHLPAGDYRIQPQGPSVRAIPVSVPGTSEVKYDPRPDNCILVRITDPAGLLARSGFRDGDLIVAIDGTELTDSKQMQALATLATKRSRTVLGVERGGSRLEIETDLSRWREWGGRLEHARR